MSDPSLPDELELAFSHIRALRVMADEIKADLIAKVTAEQLNEAQIAEIYWRFDEIPAIALGPVHLVIDAARQYPWWSWRCQGCGEEVFVTSRSDLKRRQRPPRWWDSGLCRKCQDEQNTARHAEFEESRAQRLQREYALQNMPYSEYLQTPEWQDRRKSALTRARYKCQVCNRSRTLHVHHRTYERRGIELSRDLIVLCDECHALYHGKGLIAEGPQA